MHIQKFKNPVINVKDKNGSIQLSPHLFELNVIDTHEVNRETTANFEVDKFGSQEVDPICEVQFPVTAGTSNAPAEDRDLIESFSPIQIQAAEQFPNQDVGINVNISNDLNTKYLNMEDNNENHQCFLDNICINNWVILDNPKISNFQNFDQQVLDEVSRDKRGINLEHIAEDQDINTSNSNHGLVDPMFDNNWIPVVTKSKRKVKPTFKILSSSKSQVSKKSSTTSLTHCR